MNLNFSDFDYQKLILTIIIFDPVVICNTAITYRGKIIKERFHILKIYFK